MTQSKKISFALFLILLALLGASQAGAQVSELWAARYNGTGSSADEISKMVVDGNGNVYITGRSRGTGFNNNFDYLTIKYSSSGDTLWARRYDGGGSGLPTDEARDMVVDSLGNVYVTGFSVGADMTSDYLTIKYDSNGDTSWTRRYSYTTNSNDNGNAIAVDELGYVYVTGTSSGDYLTICYDASGVFQWTARYNGTGNDVDIAKHIIYKNGALYVSGISRNTFNSSISNDYLTVKYSLNGDSLWVSRYNGPGDNYDEPTSMIVDNADNVYLTGFSRNTSSASSSDYLTIKYNQFGDSVWVNRYDGTGSGQDEANDLAIDNSGNVYVTGTSVGASTFSDYATIKYNSTGSQQWITRYHGPFNTSNDYAHSIALSPNGFIYVTGGSNNSSITTTDIVTIKYNMSGDQQWMKSYSGTGNGGDMGYQIEIYDTDFIYVSGNSEGISAGQDYITIKYEKTTGITTNPGSIPNSFRLYQNYPNPFNPSTKIKFDIPEQVGVSLKIYNLLGKEIATLLNRKLDAGTYEYEWNASHLPSGVYFYSIQAGKHRETKKLVLSK